MLRSTICARRNELLKKRMVLDSGRKRRSPNGKNLKMVVWIANEPLCEER